MRISKISFFALGFFWLTTTAVRAQTGAAADSLQTQATRMGNCLIAGDYSTFIHYLYPKVVEMAGGADKLRTILAQAFSQMSQVGMSLQSVSTDAPTAIIKVGTQLQSTAQQHTTIKLSQGHIVNTSTLICISNDNGLHWKFLDTNHKTTDDVKQLLPNLSSAIVIPQQQPPVHSDN